TLRMPAQQRFDRTAPIIVPQAIDWGEGEVTMPRPPSYRNPQLSASSSETPPGIVQSVPPPPRRSLALPALIGACVALLGALVGVTILVLSPPALPKPKLHSAMMRIPTRTFVPRAELPGCKAMGSALLVSERAAPFATISTAGAGPGRAAVGVTS